MESSKRSPHDQTVCGVKSSQQLDSFDVSYASIGRFEHEKKTTTETEQERKTWKKRTEYLLVITKKKSEYIKFGMNAWQQLKNIQILLQSQGQEKRNLNTTQTFGQNNNNNNNTKE